jgi:hypothetical protein
MNLYKKLWSRFGGRPWTYIIRDLWHRFEWLWIIGLVSAGYWLGTRGYDHALASLIAFNLGYVAGHIFWGTEYVPGQKGEG